jgi:hypothetical protein
MRGSLPSDHQGCAAGFVRFHVRKLHSDSMDDLFGSGKLSSA